MIIFSNFQTTKSGLFFLPEDTAGESEDSLSSFPGNTNIAVFVF